MPVLLRHKASCPAVLASRPRSSIGDSSDIEESSLEHIDTDERLAALHRAIEDDSIYLVSRDKQVTNKRSFLLDNILDDLEGRPAKSHDIMVEGQRSGVPGALQITTPSTNNSPRKLKRKASDFDILYGSAKSRQEPGQNELSPYSRKRYIIDNSTPLPTTEEDWSSRGRQLRSKKSMIAMSIERSKALSPSRNGLERFDSNNMTSFDALLEIPAGFKADPCLPAVMMSSPSAIKFHANGTMGPTITPRQDEKVDVSAQKRRNIPRLRHVKSAKDILQKYSSSQPVSNKSARPAVPKLPCFVQDKDEIGASSIKTKRETALRKGLRDLLKRSKR